MNIAYSLFLSRFTGLACSAILACNIAHAGGAGHDHDTNYDTEVITHSHGDVGGYTTNVPTYSAPVFTRPAYVGGTAHNPFRSLLSGDGYSYVRADLGRFDHEARFTSAGGTTVDFNERQNYMGGRFGYMFNQNLGIEARLGISDDKEVIPTGVTTGPISSYAVKGFGALFGRAQLDLGNGFIPYANLGIAGVRSTFESATATVALEDKNTKLGLGGAVGLEVNFASNLVFGIDYFRMPKSVQGLGLSLGYNF